MYKSITNLKVRYVETDQMGIVHHSNYYIYFEAAREDFIKGAGISYKYIEDTGIMMPLIETQCRYIEGAKYGDNIKIETTLEELTPVKITLNYNVIRESDNKLISKGKTIQTFVDKNNFKIINIKKKNPEIWDKLEKLK
ncbi:acyl-CoA thioester hydrolase [Clostridium sp. USBA 49]|jgi:acyl-CoA thioester hydrolase|uniref:acyl-CoA thioesterase n=1 Tax=Clostridium sp. USBA 49 TaxID=1881060 RepID=UPI000999F799|nr:thioesterase family protein [Clostridium sp. USBA 49]SKA89069.1 acyl-CoA thioester hydrolase [Clostridium sp. USBA 49]